METGTEAGTNGKTHRRAAARKDSDGIEKVIDLHDLPERIKTLEKLCIKLDEAKKDYNEAVKKTAEKCGLQASVINRGVKAIVADKVAEKKRDAEQLAMVFEEIGE